MRERLSEPGRGARSDGGRIRGVSAELRNRAWELRKHPTPSEALLWEHLQGRSLCGARFRSQHPVETFIFDFYCPESRLVIEVDGGIHEQPDVAHHDVERQRYLEQQGYRFLRFTNTDIEERLAEVLEKIKNSLMNKIP